VSKRLVDIRGSVVTLVNGQIEVHALTISAIFATNPEGALEAVLARGLERLASTNEDDPTALRGEMIHHDRVFLGAKKLFGLENSAVLDFGNNLANGHYSLGRYQEALQVHEDTLRVKERVLGAEHSDTLLSRTNLANCYRIVGRHHEGIDLDEETLRIREKVLGPKHPHTLFSRNNLALGRMAMGDYPESIRLDEETLRIREQVLGMEHPDTLLLGRRSAGGDPKRGPGLHALRPGGSQIG